MSTWILGAADPEMERIEQLISSGRVLFAARNGKRVGPSEAYNPDGFIDKNGKLLQVDDGGKLYFVECAATFLQARVVIIDHHRPGDPGYGKGPEEYLAASSLGQVLKILGLQPTPEDLLIAAGDHCPAAAYQGRCPGVDPDALMMHRVTQAAKFQRRSVQDVLAEVRTAIAEIEKAPRLVLGGVEVADLRDRVVPGLPEASLRLGVPVIYAMPGTQKDPRRKIGILGAGEGSVAGPSPVKEFMRNWAPAQGLCNIYGDPVRGFAGGYLSD